MRSRDNYYNVRNTKYLYFGICFLIIIVGEYSYSKSGSISADSNVSDPEQEMISKTREFQGEPQYGAADSSARD